MLKIEKDRSIHDLCSLNKDAEYLLTSVLAFLGCFAFSSWKLYQITRISKYPFDTNIKLESNWYQLKSCRLNEIWLMYAIYTRHVPWITHILTWLLTEVKTVATTIIIISNHWQNINWFWYWIAFIVTNQVGMFLFVRTHLLGGKRKLIQHISFPRNMFSLISQSQLYFIEYLMNTNKKVNNLISIVWRYTLFQGFQSAQQIDNFEFIHSKMIFYRYIESCFCRFYHQRR